jgi:23S rRNA pseudouridine955/2504/2580 synthase
LKKFLIKSIDKDLRIDKWLKKNFSSLKQGFLEKNLRKGNIKVNNKKIISKYKLQDKDEVKIFNYSVETYFHQPKETSLKITPSKYIQLFNTSLIYENDEFIIINKWSGIATQGGSKINISIDHIIKGISPKYNLVHRLDRETSGLLVIAKNLETTRHFGRLFKERLIEKVYIATCQGVPKNTQSEIKLSIADKKDPNKISDSITRYKVFETNDKLSNIIFTPKTGKTHQIRIVSKHLGCPIVGDTKYNIQNKYNFEKLKLHSYILKFFYNGKDYEFSADLPDHFKIFFKKNNLKNFNLKKIKDIL